MTTQRNGDHGARCAGAPADPTIGAEEEDVEQGLAPPARPGREDREDEGRRHPHGHKVEHAVEMNTGAVVCVTTQDADKGEYGDAGRDDPFEPFI